VHCTASTGIEEWNDGSAVCSTTKHSASQAYVPSRSTGRRSLVALILLSLLTTVFIPSGTAAIYRWDDRELITGKDAEPGAELIGVDQATRHTVLAQGHKTLGENDAARQQYVAVLKIRPDNVAIRLRLAKLLLSSDIGAATKQFERIVELDPNNDEAARHLATQLAASGSDADWKRALRLLQQGQGANRRNSCCGLPSCT
jgi:tetratricopeptide (TPR) repeat protein